MRQKETRFQNVFLELYLRFSTLVKTRAPTVTRPTPPQDNVDIETLQDDEFVPNLKRLPHEKKSFGDELKENGFKLTRQHKHAKFTRVMKHEGPPEIRLPQTLVLTSWYKKKGFKKPDKNTENCRGQIRTLNREWEAYKKKRMREMVLFS